MRKLRSLRFFATLRMTASDFGFHLEGRQKLDYFRTVCVPGATLMAKALAGT
jgi:hypothetical protein